MFFYFPAFKKKYLTLEKYYWADIKRKKNAKTENFFHQDWFTRISGFAWWYF